MRKKTKKLVIVFAIFFSLFFLINVNKAYAETSEFTASYIYSKSKVQEVLNIVNKKELKTD